MTDNNFGSVNTGSPIGGGVPNPNSFSGTMGQTPASSAPQVDSAQHAELESLVGRQGQELGEFRKFFADISPLLDKLDASPEIVQAILDGKITGDIAKAAMEGKVSVGDAQIISKAHEDVKKGLGKDYSNLSTTDVAKMVEERANEIKTDFDAKLKERDDLSAFESSVNDFINRTPDFATYASEVDKWLDAHNDVTDIAVAYYAVKGELSEKEALKKAEIDNAEAQKNYALNAGGGSNRATYIRDDGGEIIDSLIASKSNPNVF